MTEAYICDYIRTPIGRYGGALAHVRADDLAAIPIKALIDRNQNVDWSELDDVILGCANQAGEDNRNLARMAGLLAGLPDSSGGVTLNRLCGSGLDAVAMAARVCGGLVKGPKAVALPLSPHVAGTPTRRTRPAIPATGLRLRSLRRIVGFATLEGGPATAPRAPVAPGADEVPPSGDRLGAGRRPMTEELALHRSHLEQPEVLAVLGRRAQARLAARDRDRLFAVGAEDVADRCAW